MKIPKLSGKGQNIKHRNTETVLNINMISYNKISSHHNNIVKKRNYGKRYAGERRETRRVL